MLNVLQLIPTLDRSGAEKQVVLLAKGLPRDRFRVEVAALTRLGPLEAELKAANIPVTLIGKPLKIDPFSLLRLSRFLKDRKFDVLHTWVFAANSYGRAAAHQAKIPVVLTSEMAVDLWKNRGHLAIDRFLSGWCDKVVGNSNAVVDFYRKSGLPDSKLAMIPSGIEAGEPPEMNVDRAAVRAEFGWPVDVPVALFAGRLMPQKGVDDLLVALDLLQHIRPRLKTIIAGAGPLRSELEERAHALRLDDNVKFVGHRDDVPRLLAASDLVVLPSLYEGMPNIVLEAMRYKKPVVATAAPGTTEVVVNGETGLLVPVKSFQAMAKAIRTVIDDPEKAREFGEAGRARVEAEFGVDRMVARFAELYETIARAKGVGT